MYKGGVRAFVGNAADRDRSCEVDAAEFAAIAGGVLLGIYLGVSFVTRTLERERHSGQSLDNNLRAELETLRALLGVIERQSSKRKRKSRH